MIRGGYAPFKNLQSFFQLVLRGSRICVYRTRRRSWKQSNESLNEEDAASASATRRPSAFRRRSHSASPDDRMPRTADSVEDLLSVESETPSMLRLAAMEFDGADEIPLVGEVSARMVSRSGTYSVW